MDSLLNLKSSCEKQMDLQHFDDDVKVNMTSSDIEHWCREYLRIHDNIKETSISKAHAIERRKTLVNLILSR